MAWDTIVGTNVGSGWLVADHQARKPGDTGGNFSEGFTVTKNGRSAFMKVFDLDKLVKNFRGMLGQMQPWIDLFEHECKLLDKCSAKQTQHVIAVLEKGVLQAPAINAGIDFQFVIFEMADADLRRHYTYSNVVDLVFVLTAAKHIALGLQELHSMDIAHSDVKPSNVLLFRPATVVRDMKLGDLGSASSKNDPIWHDASLFVGDTGYAPPEVLYGEDFKAWHDRRQAKDLWMLGSLIVFLVTKVSLNSQLLLNVPAGYQPGAYGDTYKNVVPVLRHALKKTLLGLAEFSTPTGKKLQLLVQELCDPDPEKRGSPRIVNRPQKFAMDRYVSSLDAMLRRVVLLGDC